MRGKDILYSKDNLLLRITPAYAGKRDAFSERKVVIWDHPRLCGEKPGNLSRTDA